MEKVRTLVFDSYKELRCMGLPQCTDSLAKEEGYRVGVSHSPSTPLQPPGTNFLYEIIHRPSGNHIEKHVNILCGGNVNHP